jgi:hypothetical protein
MALKRFSSRLERLSRGFLDSRLNSAIAYDRIAGYFRSSVFEIAGEALTRSMARSASYATPASTFGMSTLPERCSMIGARALQSG